MMVSVDVVDGCGVTYMEWKTGSVGHVAGWVGM